MNYVKHYTALIERAQNRSILPGIYFEIHHIIPRCMGGPDSLENLVKLFPEEHYVAHQILVKIYPTNDKLLSAVIVMGGKKKNRKCCNNKTYSWLKKRLSELRKGRPGRKWTEEQKLARSEQFKGREGRILTQDEIDRRTATRKLKNSGSKRKPRTDETKQKISESLKLRNLIRNLK